MTWAGLYGAVALAAGAALVRRAGPAWVIPLGAAGGLLAAVRLVLQARRADRAILARLLGIAGLALTAPGAYAAARGGWPADAWSLWFLVWAYFSGRIFLVRAHVAARAKDVRQQAVRRWRRAALAYHCALFPVVGTLAVAGAVPPLALLGLAPAAWRGIAVARHGPVAEAVARVGWREVACGLTFAVLLILAYRLDGAVRAW